MLERSFAKKGSKIIKQGSKGNIAYLIQSGKVRVFTSHDTHEKELSILGPGDIFGEMALFTDEPRAANVEALEDTTLILITRNVMNQKIEKSDPTVRALLPMLAKRLLNTNKALLQQDSSITDFIKQVRYYYKNLRNDLPAAKKRSLDNAVKPAMDEFTNALETFHARYKDD